VPFGAALWWARKPPSAGATPDGARASRRNRVSTSALLKGARIASIQPACAAAMAAKRVSPLPVRRTKVARRSPARANRSTLASATRRSTMPVTLPLDTIKCRESSLIFMPFGARESAAITSNFGNVVANSALNRRRNSASMLREVRNSLSQSLSFCLSPVSRRRARR
jgi:hypothetical protein